MSQTDVASLGTILGVWAHPDDETYLSAGLMTQAIRNGQRVVCVTATKGEAGSQDEERWPLARLAAIREAELMESLRILGVTEHHWLDYPDGGCDKVPGNEGTAKVAALIEAVQPNTVLTFGPDGQTGHPDHIAVCDWTTAAVQQSGSAAQLYYSTVTPEWWAGPGTVLDQHDVWFAGRPSITEPDDLAINFAPDPELMELKYQAISAQESQSAGLLAAIGKDFFMQFGGEETYRNP
ncbi:MAG: N-acetyl-D-myo-inositol-2-amino-2-deoxy-alpha-D-glucopyranoside deacetylase [Actinomycetota bacterium]|jgi:LmbE family N-acetylglucosaminyl deacetylase|nr:N-acetyl-D-myo-inositol-2-amino-2-deoxy-alpha-D-glucopyranoside deacetylase [Actinomycetota bacterium]